MTELLNRPLYTTSDLSLIISLSSNKIRRWSADIPSRGTTKLDEQYVYSYRDLVILDVAKFLSGPQTKNRKPMPARERRAVIRYLANQPEIFTSKSFTLSTDGLETFLNHQNEDIATRQFAFRELLEDLPLDKRIFDGFEKLCAWNPVKKFQNILIHPTIAFGKPYIKGRHLRSQFIHKLHIDIGHKLSDLAWEYDIDQNFLEEAVAFQAHLLEAKLKITKATIH